MAALGSTWNPRPAELELPEEINLQLEVANVGSRTLAILADVALCGSIIFAVYALTFLLGGDLATDWMTRFGTGALQIALLLAIFGFQWVYFNWFEWLWNGQTPGKRLLNLRVIKTDGTPITWIDVLLRNISRPIDTFGPMGLIGLLMIFVSGKGQRLGDLMAQTLVIHEAPIDWSIFDELEAKGDGQKSATPPAPAIRLGPAHWELLHRFLNRRDQLPSEIREALAGSLREKLQPLTLGTELERSALRPEAWLLELARRT